MRHGKALKKFGRTAAHRRSLLRNLATSLILNEKCQSTVVRAKSLRRVVEKLITLAKEDTLAHRRSAYSYLLDKKAVVKLFTELGPRFKSRPGGYLRVLKTSFRNGDAANLAVIALLSASESGSKKSRSKSRTKKVPAKSEAIQSAPAESAVAS